MAGSIAQWLRRRSSAGRLSLIYACSMAGRWPLCGYSVLCGSANHQANSSSFHPSGIGKWV